MAFEPDHKPSKSDGEARFGLRITPAAGGRTYSLRTSSEEERRVWAEAMENAAHPVSAFRSLGAGRTLRLTRPADGRLGIDLGSQPGLPCVTVINLTQTAAEAGLLVGDVIVAIDNTVLRTLAIAERQFARVQPRGAMNLRLAGWNREVRMVKQAGISGLTLTAPVSGSGVLVHSIVRDSAATACGLHVGDRILAINSRLCEKNEHEKASDWIRQALQEVKFVLSGVTVALSLRKDTDGRLGLGFHKGSAGRSIQGAIISDVVPRSTAFHAGLRNGDLIVSVDGPRPEAPMLPRLVCHADTRNLVLNPTLCPLS